MTFPKVNLLVSTCKLILNHVSMSFITHEGSLQTLTLKATRSKANYLYSDVSRNQRRVLKESYELLLTFLHDIGR